MRYLDRYTVVLNGEIYNFLELRKILERAGHRFRSSSDTEVLVAAFAEWGPASLERLRGMWAFAIWDSAERRLFLARDRLGKKPLFYFEEGGRFAFASEQKALIPFQANARPRSDFRALCSNPYSYEATEHCLFAGLKRFPAGHYAWLTDKGLEIVSYWAAGPRRTDVPERYEEQVEALRSMLLESCSFRMRSDVPIGTGLSGGLDSSAVAAGVARQGRSGAVNRLHSNWQNAFTASFPDTVMDETVHARSVAEHLGIRLHEVPIDPAGHIDAFEEWVYLFEEVHEVNPLPHIMLYREMRDRGVVVSLDGHGGDELFCGYESSILHALPEALGSPSRVLEILRTYEDCHPSSEDFRRMSSPRILLYLVRATIRRIVGSAPPSGYRPPPGLKSLNTHLHELVARTVLPTLLRNYDRYSMISGVEIRMPLLDHEIVEFALALPSSSKVRGGRTKAILRDAVAPWLPRGIVERKDKIGFAPPIRQWMKGPLREYLMDEISSRSFKEAELIDPVRLANEISGLASGGRVATLYETERTWKEFSIYLWEKVFVQERRWRARP